MVIIGQVSGRHAFESKFEIPFPENHLLQKNYCISERGKAWIVHFQKTYKFALFHYGMIPFWSGKEFLHFESPVEGSLNPDAERTKKRIIVHPSYRRPIRQNRCLVPANFFFVLNELHDPWLVFSMASDTFALAAIYDNWKESYHQKDFYQGFSLLTVAAPKDFQHLGISRLPLIIPERKYKRWLNPDAALAEITELMENTHEMDLNSYPVSKTLFMQKRNSRDICKPQGDLLRSLPPDQNKIAAFLRSFRFRRGVTHQNAQDESRIWRG